jgi:hypothetical protein
MSNNPDNSSQRISASTDRLQDAIRAIAVEFARRLGRTACEHDLKAFEATVLGLIGTQMLIGTQIGMNLDPMQHVEVYRQIPEASDAAAIRQPTCPWTITSAAIGQYIALRGEQDSPLRRAKARAELEEIAIEYNAKKTALELDSGALQYRGGRPDRFRFVVVVEADKSRSLVSVLASHEGARPLSSAKKV